MQESGQINSRGAGADNGNPTAFEAGNLFVVGTVRKKFLRYIGKDRRDVAEVSYTGSNDDAFAADDVSVLRGELEAVGYALDRGYFGFFKPSDKALLELEAVRDEGFDGNRKTDI
jgi:hypothetical protein